MFNSNFIDNILVLSPILIILMGLLIWLINYLAYRKRFFASLHYKLLSIRVPKEGNMEKSGEDHRKIAEIISASEQIISSLSQYKKPIAFEITSPIGSKEIMFYVACPKKEQEYIKKIITAFYPFAEVREATDYSIFAPQNHTVGSYLTLEKPYGVPLKTYQNFENDPLNLIVNGLSNVQEGEGAAIQIILKPAGGYAKKKIIKDIGEARKGKNYNDLFKKAPLFDPKVFIKDMTSVSEEEKKFKDMKPVDETLVKNMEAKASTPLFEVNVRLVVSSSDKFHANFVLGHLESGFAEIAMPNMNSFKIKKVSHFALTNFVFKYVYRLFETKNEMVLNSSEINTI